MHEVRTRPARARATAFAVAFAAAILAGCQAAATPSPTAGPTVAPTPTQAPSAAASPQASGIAALEVSGHVGVLDPGRYTRKGFEPRITFELEGPWHSVAAYHGFFDVEQDVGSPDVIAVQFAMPEAIYTSAVARAEVANAQAAAEALKGNARFVIVESSASRIGGLDGFQVTVENAADKTGDAPVLQVAPGALSISPGRRLWCAFFDTPQGVLAVLVGGSVAKWDEALAAAEPVLESVTIGQ